MSKPSPPPKDKQGNVYELRRLLFSSIGSTFAGQSQLTDHQVRGALARYFEFFKPEFKSIAFSGWGPELIPDDDILQSQFPEVLAEMEKNRLRLAELAALFAAADEEDYEDSDDTGVLPGDEVKRLKAELKELNAQAKLAKKEGRKGDWSSYTAEAAEIEKRLLKHKALEDEVRDLKAQLRATEKKQEELVTAARAKIDTDEAKRVILDRLHRILIETYEGYLRADQRACLAALENLHAKYAVTAKAIEAKRDPAKLKTFLETGEDPQPGTRQPAPRQPCNPRRNGLQRTDTRMAICRKNGFDDPEPTNREAFGTSNFPHAEMTRRDFRLSQ